MPQPKQATMELPENPRGVINALLDFIERVGNRLPDQVTIFMGLAVLTLVLSAIAAAAGWSVTHPVTHETVAAKNLVNGDGIRWILANVVTNFTSFAPLGTVLVAMIGVGVAERAGLFSAMLRALVTSVPRWAITPTVVFAGVMANLVADAGYVILPPLAGMLYASLGRHPFAGIVAAVAGVGAGFSANLLLSPIDPLLAGLTQQAAQLFHPTYRVNAACNYYFMAVSTVLLTLVGWFVADRIVEPRLGRWESPADLPNFERVDFGPLSRGERRGMLAAGISSAALIAIIALLVVPEQGILRDGEAAPSERLVPFFDSIVAILLVFFLVPGFVYGVATGQIKSDRHIARMMAESMASMGQFLVMAFFAGQFIAWFNHSKLGMLIAVEGAEFLKGIHLTGIGLMIGFVLFSVTIDLVMASASAKWTFMAPIFVPMFMALGEPPEATQAYYRVGDSVANIITPLNYYFPLVLAATHRYVPSARLGTLIAALFPFSLAFLIVWTALLVIWLTLGWPLGPGVPLRYPHV